jgi:hypothetical protein
MSIEDYLYLDTRRLDSYIQQIGSPKKWEKTSAWKAGISLTGPEASATQNVLQRDLTVPEKIDRLRAYLKEQNRLGVGRFRDKRYLNANQKFRLEECNAAEIYIPPAEPEDFVSEIETPFLQSRVSRPVKRGLGGSSLTDKNRAIAQREAQLQKARNRLQGFKGIRLWFSPEVNFPLFLLLDFRQNDEETFGRMSTYTALFGAFEGVEGIDKTRLSIAIEKARHGHSEVARRFIRDPLNFLEAQGAEVIHWRKIRTLYQVRSVFYDKASKDMATLVTIGYALFISDADSFSSIGVE